MKSLTSTSTSAKADVSGIFSAVSDADASGARVQIGVADRIFALGVRIRHQITLSSSDPSNTSKSFIEMHRLACLPISDDKAHSNDVEKSKVAISYLRAFCHNQLHAYPFSQVPLAYIRGFVNACVLSALFRLEYVLLKQPKEVGEKFPADAVVSDLDTALIVGGPAVSDDLRKLVNELFIILKDVKIDDRQSQRKLASKFLCPPGLKEKILARYIIDSRFAVPSIDSAENLEGQLQKTSMVSSIEGLSKQDPQTSLRPVYIPGLARSWPASQKWNDSEYLLAVTNNGMRVVPVEIGSSYVSDSWGQKLCKFGDLLQEWLSPLDGSSTGRPVSYMAQHDLLKQIAPLRSDIAIPDIIYSTPSFTYNPDEPITINAWIGPSGTISPLHTDPHNNILTQVVGFKYVRLYPPTITGYSMYPRSEDGFDMSNTSEVELELGCYGALFGDGNSFDDIGSVPSESEMSPGVGAESQETPTFSDQLAAIRSRMREKREYRDQYGDFCWDHGYYECILKPGDALFIPGGWWHYVRSLSNSFSVNFWFGATLKPTTTS
ncbi:hypothetical protein BZA70DRAFT_39597 [Myxozyma melibiosi]|uniref:JmjC domain-containing protein n=1 Tax=Myxozyma melibiosi TaxID=54550 RepID=A0ABR1FEM0_9ASCO